MTTTNRPEPIEIHSWDDVPRFANEDEERAYWETHSLGSEILEQTEDVSEKERAEEPNEPSESYMLTLPPELLDHLRSIAHERQVGLHTMLLNVLTRWSGVYTQMQQKTRSNQRETERQDLDEYELAGIHASVDEQATQGDDQAERTRR